MSKKIWKSKTFWANILAGSAIIAQAVAGYDILNPEVQVAILAGINVILRMVTNGPVEWK